MYSVCHSYTLVLYAVCLYKVLEFGQEVQCNATTLPSVLLLLTLALCASVAQRCTLCVRLHVCLAIC